MRVWSCRSRLAVGSWVFLFAVYVDRAREADLGGDLKAIYPTSLYKVSTLLISQVCVLYTPSFNSRFWEITENKAFLEKETEGEEEKLKLWEGEKEKI